MLGRLTMVVVDLIEAAVIGVSIFLVVYLFLMQPHQVSGHSMDPNLNNSDYLLTDKISYRFNKPQRGDIVVFHAPDAANCVQGTGCDYIKRIIGLPNETVEVKDNAIYINGSLLEESYLPAGTLTHPGDFTRDRAVTMGPDEYFVVGDNRGQSSDSRVWGGIQPDNIVGRAFFRYLPVNLMGAIEHATYTE